MMEKPYIKNLMNYAKVEAQVDAYSQVTSPIMWVVIESRLLDGEKFLLVFDKSYLKEARQKYPDNAIYFPPEIRELYRNKDNKNFIKHVHLAKKEFKGWIVPSEKTEGGVEHAGRRA